MDGVKPPELPTTGAATSILKKFHTPHQTEPHEQQENIPEHSAGDEPVDDDADDTSNIG
jgi:hypothetical protein